LNDYTCHMKQTMITLVVVGQIIWVVAAIVGLLVNADSKFLWTCFIGAALGLVGIRYTIRRDHRSGL